MARKVRIEYPGAAYHVMSRGNRGADLFVDDDDRRSFLQPLADATEKTAWEIHRKLQRVSRSRDRRTPCRSFG